MCGAGKSFLHARECHGLVRLIPCFSPSLALVWAENRHEAKFSSSFSSVDVRREIEITRMALRV